MWDAIKCKIKSNRAVLEGGVTATYVAPPPKPPKPAKSPTPYVSVDKIEVAVWRRASRNGDMSMHTETAYVVYYFGHKVGHMFYKGPDVRVAEYGEVVVKGDRREYELSNSLTQDEIEDISLALDVISIHIDANEENEYIDRYRKVLAAEQAKRTEQRNAIDQAKERWSD